MTPNADVQLRRFQEAAENFIQVVDSRADLQCERFLAVVSHCLADLYSSALDLPVIEPETDSVDETPFDIESWTKLCVSIRSKIGPLDTYWTIFDSTENKPAVQGTLAGDIAEIYFDLLLALHTGHKRHDPNDFLWDLRSSFRSHWGKHLLRALGAIHDHHVE